MRTTTITTFVLTAALNFSAEIALAGPQKASAAQQPSPEQQLLQRIYQARMRIDQDRARIENEARANVRLVTQSGGGTRRGADSPTVTSLRHDTNQQLARFENQFRCLDVDLEATTGNTVVICGDNSGDITSTNVSAERDIVTLNGGAP